ncbi:ZYBA0S09-00672g1_1 [Zygosaccharomyces bailii CLIB 213]|uniref:ZYBA0S09-00672g1_1 n=1 Tax=Zygosaccharomyces bailii (strain CLIB 213 / ATCC 58445 / CBS 680 / BCRC 21525 / NBRC 1098 / NCYC 1416 / NRRL Y-2227) TaxID=1333698 RepID=A0A8J2XCT8_ZYGB2|nr:ZYBA0S09-00672g1_1 [Zygosaccharomyces bailii CLIB 213]
MTSAYDFYSGLLRVSIIQLLKAQGFDRARPTTVDVITDLYIRYLGLLTAEITKMARSRIDFDDTVSLQDITLAFQSLGVTKPVDVLDVYDENPELPSDRGMGKFKEWCIKDRQPKETRSVALPTADLLKSKPNISKPLSLIPEYINQLQQKQDPTHEGKGDQEDELIEELINNGDLDDWIKFVLTKQRINLAKRISGKDPQNIQSLPSIAGFKYSMLESSHNMSSNEVLPTPLESAEEGDTLSKAKYEGLLQKLPLMRPECRLENITLSYENEKYDPSSDDEEGGAELQNYRTDTEGKRTGVHVESDTFALDPNVDTNFEDLEDMDATFQRRDYLDLDEHPQDFQFDFDAF